MKKTNKKIIISLATAMVIILSLFSMREDKSSKIIKKSSSRMVEKSVVKPKVPQKEISTTLKEKTEVLLKSMPLQKDMAALSNAEVHHSPKEFNKQVIALAHFKESAMKNIKNQKVARVASAFYKECADNIDVLTSIRTVCLYNRLIFAKAANEIVDISYYPSEMRLRALKMRPF